MASSIELRVSFMEIKWEILKCFGNFSSFFLQNLLKKVGFCGEDAPRAVLPTVMATATADENREDEGAVGVWKSSLSEKNWKQRKYVENMLNIYSEIERNWKNSNEIERTWDLSPNFRGLGWLSPKEEPLAPWVWRIFLWWGQVFYGEEAILQVFGHILFF